MVTYADSSFLFSIYGNDAHSDKATAWLSGSSSPISVTELTLFEPENALRFSSSRGFIPVAQRDGSLGRIADAEAAGRLTLVVCNLANIVRHSRRISEMRTPAGAHRAFDILHVAIALEIGATLFLTFDDNRRSLAHAEGLHSRLNRSFFPTAGEKLTPDARQNFPKTV